jgi:hypothetical protein
MAAPKRKSLDEKGSGYTKSASRYVRTTAVGVKSRGNTLSGLSQLDFDAAKTQRIKHGECPFGSPCPSQMRKARSDAREAYSYGQAQGEKRDG